MRGNKGSAGAGPVESEREALRRRVAALEVDLEASRIRENELREQVERWEAFARINPVWFWETDENLRYTFFSANVETLAGVPPEWHYGKTREEIGAPETLSSEDWHAHLETLRSHAAYKDFIFEREGPNGVQWMCSSGVPFFDENGAFKGYRGVGSDVTESVNANFRADILLEAIEQLDETFVIWDRNDRLLVCNERFREFNEPVLGTTQPGTKFEDHIRAALEKGLFPEAYGKEEKWFAQRLRRYRNPGPPFEQQRLDGKWLLVHEQKVANGATVTISTDITTLRKASGDEREKAAILDTTFDAIPDGIQVLNRNLELTYWNDRLFSIMGLDKDAVLNADNPRHAFFRMLAERGEYGEGDPAELAADRQRYLMSMEPIRFARQLKTGTWVEGRGTPMAGGEGYVTIYRDITERRRLDRLKGEFVSTVSHELRTPLTSIHGFLDLVMSKLESGSTDDIASLVEIAHKNSQRLVSLVNDILDMDKASAGKLECQREPVSIAAIVEESVTLNQGLSEQYDVTFAVGSVAPGVKVDGDTDRLIQVVTNLLSNAAKYASPGGRVEISAVPVHGAVRVTVRDDGPGIPDDFRDRIFERFSRTESAQAHAVPGSGLGLYISKTIVELHDGHIDFAPAPGGGTDFFFELPVLAG